MNKKIVALSLLLILTLMCVSSIAVSTVKAQTSGGWITSYQIYDYSSKNLLVESTNGVNQTLSPVLPGEEVEVVFTVNVFTAGSGDLSLQTSLGRLLQGYFWQLQTQTYALGSDFNPNSNPADFTWTQGTFTMDLYGIVPTPSSTEGQAPVNVVSLYGPTGGLLAQIQISSTSAAMAQFETLYGQKEAHLKTLLSEGVVQGYTQLYTNVLNASLATANAGDVTNAIAMLNTLNIANEPASATMQALFLPLIVVVAVVAVIFAFMFMRIRGKVSYMQLVVEDQIKDLEGLTLRISKIDRQSSSNLESVKDRLKRLVGM